MCEGWGRYVPVMYFGGLLLLHGRLNKTLPALGYVHTIATIEFVICERLDGRWPQLLTVAETLVELLHSQQWRSLRRESPPRSWEA
jgi:hypothetical protein